MRIAGLYRLQVEEKQASLLYVFVDLFLFLSLPLKFMN